MLAIRMQRTGRKGFATYRIVVQDVRQTPSSGRVVALLGNYNPHTKEVKIDKDKATFFVTNGAHPSSRVTVLLKKEGVKLPKWVEMPAKSKKTTKNIEKLRKNRPAEPVAQEPKTEEVPAEVPAESPEPAEKPADAVEETAAPEAAPAEEAQKE